MPADPAFTLAEHVCQTTFARSLPLPCAPPNVTF